METQINAVYWADAAGDNTVIVMRLSNAARSGYPFAGGATPVSTLAVLVGGANKLLQAFEPIADAQDKIYVNGKRFKLNVPGMNLKFAVRSHGDNIFSWDDWWCC